MMRPLAMTAALGLLAASLTLAAPQRPPTPAAAAAPLTFGSEVELVTVDAVAVDNKGVPITGLRREDFTVSEEGTRQPIVSFEAIRPPATPPPPAARQRSISTNTGPPVRNAQIFAVVFDDMHMTPLQAYHAKLAVADFLHNGVHEGDRVLLLATSGGAWWNARMFSGRDELMGVLKRCEGRRVGEAIQDRITDYESMMMINRREQRIVGLVTKRFESAGLTAQLKQEDDDKQLVHSDINPYIETRAREAYNQTLARDRLGLGAMRRLLDGLSAGRGRKSVILVSAGFIFNPALGEFRDVVNAARRANSAVYFLNTRGLDNNVSPYSAEFGGGTFGSDVIPLFADLGPESEGAETLAVETGGFTVQHSGDLTAGLARIASESRGYYLIGYSPSETYQDGRFRHITVRVNRKGVTVRARRGYFAASPGLGSNKPKEEDDLDPEIQQTFDSPFDAEAVPLRMTAYALGETLIDRAKVVVVADVDIRNLAFSQSEGRLIDNLEVLLVVSHRESGEVFQYSEMVQMRLRPQTLAKTPWYPLTHAFDLGPGAYSAKLVVRDQNNKKSGSLVHPFELPDLGSFRTSTLILSDTLTSAPESPGVPVPVPLARRTFSARGSLYAQIEVFNASRNSQSGQPEVVCGHKLLAQDGRVVRGSEPTPIVVQPKGPVTRLLALSLDGLEPGEYELALNIADTVTGKTLDLHEPFTLEPATSAPDKK